MTNELFPESQMSSESPRLKWIKRYGVVIGWDEQDEEYTAAAYSVKQGRRVYGYGGDDLEALAMLAQRLGVKLWNEEEK